MILFLIRKAYWIKERQLTIDFNDSVSGKIYPFKYDYLYQATKEGKTTITVNGSFNAATIIEINGSVNNPELNSNTKWKDNLIT